jgi:hypothetical protein
MKVKIFSDPEYLLKKEGVRPHPMLHPFWPQFAEKGSYPWRQVHNHYMESGHNLFEMVPLEEADFAVMPDDWRTVRGELWYSEVNKEAEDLYLQFAQKAEAAGKPIIVFFGSDLSDEEVSLKNAFIFRHSYYRSRKKSNNFVWPAFGEDLVEHYLENQISIRQKSEKPIVGFCGLIKRNSLNIQLKKLAYYSYMLVKHKRRKFPPIQGHILRAKVLDTLEKSSLVETNFVIYDRSVFLGQNDSDKIYKNRMEYIQNLIGSDYVVCCRGAGNFSNRLFETLCVGRIPILIDTDCVLPYDFAIDWKKYCVWVDEKEIPSIGEKVAEFHEKISPQDFIDLQHECRKFWQEWLSTEGFFSKFYLHFQ